MIPLTYLVKVNQRGHAVDGLLIAATDAGGLVLFESGEVRFYLWEKIIVNVVEVEVAFRDNRAVLDRRIAEHVEQV